MEEHVEKNTDALGGERRSHPSYGMMCFSRITGGDPHLFGTSIKHNDKISLVLRTAEYDRSLNQNWYYGKKELFEVEMSYTQFVELITHMNMGSGVPVTIKRILNERTPPVPYKNPVEEHDKEFRKHLDEVYSKSQELIDTVEQKFKEKKSFNKKEQEEILSALRQISHNIGCNQSFQLSQFHEQMEKTVTESKGEIEAFMQNKMYQIAQQAMVENPEKLFDTPVKAPQIGETPKKSIKLKSLKGGNQNEKN